MGWYLNGRKGAQGELLAAIDLMEKGFEVFRAVDPVASTDLIAHRDGASWRIQVKTGKPELTPIREGRQEIVAWVQLDRRAVSYDPGLPHKVAPMKEDRTFDATQAKAAQAVERAATSGPRGFLNNGDVWKARFRCQNDKCDVRLIEITVKEFDNDPPHVRGPFTCPACRSSTTIEWARNSTEWQEEERREARFSVNMQLEAQRQQAKGKTLVVYSHFSDKLPKVVEDE